MKPTSRALALPQPQHGYPTQVLELRAVYTEPEGWIFTLTRVVQGKRCQLTTEFASTFGAAQRALDELYESIPERLWLADAVDAILARHRR